MFFDNKSMVAQIILFFLVTSSFITVYGERDNPIYLVSNFEETEELINKSDFSKAGNSSRSWLNIALDRYNGNKLLAESDRLKIVAYLIGLGVDINESNTTVGEKEDGPPPIYYAVRSNYVKIVKLLINKKFAIDWVSENGDNLLFIAAIYCKNIDMVELLVRGGLKVDYKNGSDTSALYYATHKNNIFVMNYLLSYYADHGLSPNPHSGNQIRLNPICIAAKLGRYSSVRVLVSYGIYHKLTRELRKSVMNFALRKESQLFMVYDYPIDKFKNKIVLYLKAFDNIIWLSKNCIIIYNKKLESERLLKINEINIAYKENKNIYMAAFEDFYIGKCYSISSKISVDFSEINMMRDVSKTEKIAFFNKCEDSILNRLEYLERVKREGRSDLEFKILKYLEGIRRFIKSI